MFDGDCYEKSRYRNVKGEIVIIFKAVIINVLKLGVKMTELEIRKEKMLEIFKAFIAICEKHNLSYFCHAGTAIGVVRHRGFIPWDDDIDVLMPRKDYEKLVAIFNENPNNELELIEPGVDQKYYLSFAKICDKNSALLEFKHIPYVLGVFIDIFILDGASNEFHIRDQDCLNYRREANKLMILPKPFLENFKWFFKRLINFQLRTAKNELVYSFNKKKKFKRTHEKLNEITKRHAYDESNFIGCYETYYGGRAFWPKEYFETYVDGEFEGITVRLPAGYKEVLTTLYGDYMELPPKEMRVTHHDIAFLDLNKRFTYDEIKKKL